MDARSERPATGYGSPEAGLGALTMNEVVYGFTLFFLSSGW